MTSSIIIILKFFFIKYIWFTQRWHHILIGLLFRLYIWHVEIRHQIIHVTFEIIQVLLPNFILNLASWRLFFQGVTRFWYFMRTISAVDLKWLLVRHNLRLLNRWILVSRSLSLRIWSHVRIFIVFYLTWWPFATCIRIINIEHQAQVFVCSFFLPSWTLINFWSTCG